VAVPTATGYEIEEFEHNMKCHDNPTFIHDVDFNSCPCGAPAAPVAFAELGEERKYTGVFPWWLIPLILLGLLLIGKLFCQNSFIFIPWWNYKCQHSNSS
jgi:hypothetical protein